MYSDNTLDKDLTHLASDEVGVEYKEVEVRIMVRYMVFVKKTQAKNRLKLGRRIKRSGFFCCRCPRCLDEGGWRPRCLDR